MARRPARTHWWPLALAVAGVMGFGTASFAGAAPGFIDTYAVESDTYNVESPVGYVGPGIAVSQTIQCSDANDVMTSASYRIDTSYRIFTEVIAVNAVLEPDPVALSAWNGYFTGIEYDGATPGELAAYQMYGVCRVTTP